MPRRIIPWGGLMLLLALLANPLQAQRFSDWSAPVNLGPTINTAAQESMPFVTRNGKSLYFISTRSGGSGGMDIWVSQRESTHDAWGTPANLGATINSSADEHCPIVTPDGHALIFASTRAGGAGTLDAYVSFRHDTDDDFAWGPPQNIAAINTPYLEGGFAVFENEDGDDETLTLYFSSNRPGGPGLSDIYESTIGEDWSFSAPVLVAELSSPDDDVQVAVRKDGRELLLSSNRPGGSGAYDIWVSTRESTSDPWSAPVNVGPVVNSAANDYRPALSWTALTMVFQSPRPGGFGGADLYETTRSKLRGGEK